MKHSDFKMGMEFTTALGTRTWQVTDLGTRTIIAIRIDEVTVHKYDTFSRKELLDRVLNRQEAETEGWFNGPPYAVGESVFDEDDFEACEPVK